MSSGHMSLNGTFEIGNHLGLISEK